jgi:SAM-dependent methyltransferase
VRAARIGWDRMADEYQAEHGAFLGAADFVWGPEGLREADAGLLGPVAGRRWLEVGGGAAQCARWIHAQGALVVALDVSARQLQHGRRLSEETGIGVPLLQADACRLPMADGSIDGAFSAYGALPFIADIRPALAELCRVLRPGSPWVFSVSHPVRWAFPDDPGPSGLTATGSYFDRRAYLEVVDGEVVYAEHHRTVGDWVAACVAAGFEIRSLLEPQWPADLDRTWGGWSRLRGERLPGTLILRTVRR